MQPYLPQVSRISGLGLTAECTVEFRHDPLPPLSCTFLHDTDKALETNPAPLINSVLMILLDLDLSCST